MMWFFAILIVLALGGIALVAAGRGAPLAEVYDDRPDARVPADGAADRRRPAPGALLARRSAATGCPRSTRCSTGSPRSSRRPADTPRIRAADGALVATNRRA